jgi:hypothetical protein
MASSKEWKFDLTEGRKGQLDAWLTKVHGESSFASIGEGETLVEMTREAEPALQILCDDANFRNAPHYRMFSGVDVEAAWSLSHEVAHTTNFDFKFVTDFEAKSLDPDRELLRGSIDGMEASNLSRLFRVVRDWSFHSVADEEPVEVVVGPEEPLEHTLVAEDALAEYLEPPEEKAFIALLYQSQHKLLERQADKDLWAWFAGFREIALAAVERGRMISGAEILEMVKRALKAKRSLPRSRPLQARHARAERLLRLAESIAPNAPPLPPLPTGLAIEAG